MKYSMQALDSALDFLLPEIKEAKDNGIKFNRPDLLKMVASQYFIKTYDFKWNPSFDERIAYYICQEAMINLNEKGWFVFGEKEWSEK